MTSNIFKKIMQFVASKFNRLEKISMFNKLTLGIQSKNLLNVTMESVTVLGVNVEVNEDNSVNLSGTLTANAAKTLGYVKLKKNVSYKLTGIPKSTNLDIRLQLYDAFKGTYVDGAVDTGDGVTYTPNEDIYVGVRMRLYTPFSTTGILVYPMLCYTEIANNYYEPYSQSNLQEYIDNTNSELGLIKSTIGNVTKNLLSVKMTTLDWAKLDFKITNGVIAVSGQNNTSNALTPSVGKIKLNAGDVIRLSGCPDGGSQDTYGLELRSLDKSKTYGGCYNSTSLIIPITETKEYYVVIMICSNYTIQGQLEFKPQVQYADIIDKTYEPYMPNLQEQIRHINELEAINKSSIGLQKKNLFKITAVSGTVHQGVTLYIDEDGLMHTTGTPTSTDSTFYLNINVPTFDKDVIISYVGNLTGCHIIARLNTTTYKRIPSEGLYVSHTDKIDRIYIQQDNDSSVMIVENVGVMLRYAEIEDDTYEPYVESLQTQINLRPILKTLDITGETSANGNIVLSDGNITLTRTNAIIVSILAITNTGNVATACSLGQSNQNYFIHCFSADKNHTISSSQTMRVLVYYYELNQ